MSTLRLILNITLKKVDFTISDMVRGKCVFLEIADIIYTVNKIKEFVKNKTQFKIT